MTKGRFIYFFLENGVTRLANNEGLSEIGASGASDSRVRGQSLVSVNWRLRLVWMRVSPEVTSQ